VAARFEVRENGVKLGRKYQVGRLTIAALLLRTLGGEFV
jgi:hypothetical protein